MSVPPSIQALFVEALALAEAERTSEAASAFARVLALDPSHVGALSGLGQLAWRGGDAGMAERFFQRAIAGQPESAALHLILGFAQRAQGKLDDAVATFARAAKLDPALAEAPLALSEALFATGRPAEAKTALRQALALRPDYAEAHMNLGNLLRADGCLAEAEHHGRRAVELAPDFAVAHYNLAVTAQDLGLLDEAIGGFEAAERLAPGWSDAKSQRLICLNYDAHLAATAIAAEHRDAAGLWDRPDRPDPAGHDRTADRRLRVGYVSGDLHHHPVGLFMTAILEAHAAERVEHFVYTNNVLADAVTARLRGAADHWREIAGLSNEAVAAQTRADQIDILVDLSGHSPRHRLAVFGAKAAPVQATYLGCVSTTGLSSIDYVLTDADVTPPGAEALYSESLVRLAHGKFCYTPPEGAPAPVPPPSAKRDWVTFGSFNNILKLGPQVIALWAEVLAATPGSRLILKWSALSEPAVCERYARAFAAQGVDPGRVEFRGFSPHAAMLVEYGDVDIALDPFPHGGGLTTCEALWMGVPVVTWPQERPVSRQSLSLLNAIGCEDLVAQSPADYVAITSALASDRARLTALRSELRPRMAASPLCDGPGFTRGLEAAYHAMWRRWTAGEDAASFDVEG